MIGNVVQIALFAMLVGFAMIGALEVDRHLAACSAGAGYLQVVQP